ncbi:calpain-2 catalytic subunit-like, partial [Pimephales promelas]|uniref:calpain-2 catalytic subunit-like n=1 Tax=Pimephales promelas TaxID=90988 RepID=UPI00195551B3
MQLHRWEELEVFFSLSNSVAEQNKSYTLLYTLPENIIRSELGIPEPRAEQRDSVKPRKRKLLKAVKMPPPRVNRIARDEQPKDRTGTLDVPLKFLDQDYQELKKSCLTNKRRFVDEKFPSDSSSIDPKKKLGLDMEQIKWLRPSKIVADPQLIVKGVSRFDYSQGSYLGNCWFLASVGALTFRDDVMDQVMPDDQSFVEDYAGIFRFR